MNLQHLIFDLDGTLIDSAPAIIAGLGTVLKKAGITPILPLDERLIGPPLLVTLSRLTGSSDAGLLHSLADAFKAYYDTEGVSLTVPYLGIDTGLRQLAQQGIKLHIATNKRWLPTQRILNCLKWSTIFSSVYTQDKNTPTYSDKSEMLADLIKSENVDAEYSAYVGDTPEDGEAAFKNGLAFIAVDWGYGSFDNLVTKDDWLRLYSQDDLFRIPIILKR
jgi:phosphoglycolate phosphatase